MRTKNYNDESDIKFNNKEEETRDSLNTYIHEIEKISLLNPKEEYELALKAKSGDNEAREKLLNTNLRFVVSVAKSFQNRGLPLEDLISEGNIGLINAIDKFQPELGNKFISYAVWWIRQSIIKAIGDKSKLIRLPMNRNVQLNSIQAAKALLEKDGSEATIEEIAQSCGIDEDNVSSLLNISNNVCSLDAPLTEDESHTFGDILEDNADGPDEILLTNSLTQAIDNIMSNFTEREKNIIILRYGLHGAKPLSLKEIGEIYGLSKERIRQIEKKIVFRLSKDESVADLKAYIA